MLRWLPLFVCLWACSDRATEPVPLLVVAPLPGPASQAEVAREDALAALTTTLTAMGHTPRVERVTPGDIEGLPFVEALRQLRNELGRERTCAVHVTLVPYIAAAGELKTKPTQHSVRELAGLGVQPDILLAESIASDK